MNWDDNGPQCYGPTQRAQDERRENLKALGALVGLVLTLGSIVLIGWLWHTGVL